MCAHAHYAPTDPSRHRSRRFTGNDAFGVAVRMVKQDSRYPRFVNCVSAGTTEIVVGYRFGVGLPVPVRICRGAVSTDTLLAPSASCSTR